MFRKRQRILYRGCGNSLRNPVRLRMIGITSLEDRRITGDMIEVTGKRKLTTNAASEEVLAVYSRRVSSNVRGVDTPPP